MQPYRECRPCLFGIESYFSQVVIGDNFAGDRMEAAERVWELWFVCTVGLHFNRAQVSVFELGGWMVEVDYGEGGLW